MKMKWIIKSSYQTFDDPFIFQYPCKIDTITQSAIYFIFQVPYVSFQYGLHKFVRFYQH